MRVVAGSNGGMPRSSSASPSVSRPRSSTFGRRPIATSTRSTTTLVVPARIAMPSPAASSSTAAPVCTANSPSRTARSTPVTFSSVRPASRASWPNAVTSTPSRDSACANSMPIAPRPTTPMRRGSDSWSNTLSLLSTCSPSAFHGAGTIGREPVAMMIRRASNTRPSTSTRLGPSSRARPAMLRPPSDSVASSVPATKWSRSSRTRRSTAGRSTVSASLPRMPNVSCLRRAWNAFAASISAFDGMQPTRAQVVP